MNPTLTAYAALICTSGVLNFYLCLYVYQKRHRYKDIADPFILYTAAISIYCFAAAFSLTSTTLAQLKFWNSIQYLGLPFFSPLGLLFVMRYVGMKVTKKKCIAFLSLPFVTWLMVVTNDLHHLHYRVVEIDPVLGAPYIYQEIGSWYVVHGIYMFSCMFVAFLLLISPWKETASVYRPQLIALMCGQLVPMLTAFLYLMGWTPQGIDPVPMVIWLSSLFYLWSINSSRLFLITPVAKDAIFNSINDGVIVLNESRQLIEYNQACRRMLPELNESMLGWDFGKVWNIFSENPFPLQIEHMLLDQGATREIDYGGRVYQVRTSLLEQAGESRGCLLIFTEITELKKLQEKLEYLAFHDELTQIYNRRAFLQQCGLEYTAAKNESALFTVVLMDIDHFKRVNDTYGHHVGDQLLVHAVNVFQSQLREDHLFARYGGEEFIVALKGYSLPDAKLLGEQLRSSLEKQPIFIEQELVTVTLSVGIAETEKEEKLEQLLNKADKALYSAKQGGRNQVCIYTNIEGIVN